MLLSYLMKSCVICIIVKLYVCAMGVSHHHIVKDISVSSRFKILFNN